MDEIIYKIKSKYVVTKKEAEQLDWLHYSDGFMWKEFNKKEKLGIVILAKENNLIVSWGLLFERDFQKTLFIYTRKSHRRLGIGSKIYKLCVQNFGKPVVSRHNKQSELFFNSIGA